VILYVNGDSHTAAAEAVNPHAFAEDDGQYRSLGRVPHPDNLAVSWCSLLARELGATLVCDAESASSNARIIRTTRSWLNNAANLQDLLVVIQWSTWEREEWLIDGTYYQVTASGQDDVPRSHQKQYRDWILDMVWYQKVLDAHQEVWQFHQELQGLNIKHIFFNGNNDFSMLREEKPWGVNYIQPYEREGTFDARLRAFGQDTVNPDSWHFGPEGHRLWQRFMLHYITSNSLV
jgi:hypothetical protein